VKYQIVLSAKAIRSLDRLDKKTEKRIQTRPEEIARKPLDARISKKLETVVGKRYSRAGDWRIIYEITGDQIFVLTVQHRSKVYQKIKE
jgi:mRNA-degrading endonuclease RelE of RelBE toxin-antitoxin system